MITERNALFGIDAVRIEFESREEFESLIYLEGNGNRFLSQEFSFPWNIDIKEDLPRTLRDILDRMSIKGWSLHALKSELADFQRDECPYPEWIHKPAWFSQCFEASELEPLRFGSLLIRHANLEEMRRAPGSQLALADGCHRALSLACAFRSGMEFKTVTGILIGISQL
jgi:hypothetical protein